MPTPLSRPHSAFEPIAHRDWLSAIRAVRTQPRASDDSTGRLDALPTELKLLILEHTGPDPFALATMQTVSRHWQQLAQDDRLWQPLYPRQLWPKVHRCAPDGCMPGPQARFAMHMHQASALRHLWFRELWQGRVQNVTLVAGSTDPIFACHAFLKIGPDWARNLRWRAQLNERRASLHAEASWLQAAELAAVMGAMS